MYCNSGDFMTSEIGYVNMKTISCTLVPLLDNPVMPGDGNLPWNVNTKMIYRCLCHCLHRCMYSLFNPIHPIGNSLKKQKLCTKV